MKFSGPISSPKMVFKRVSYLQKNSLILFSTQHGTWLKTLYCDKYSLRHPQGKILLWDNFLLGPAKSFFCFSVSKELKVNAENFCYSFGLFWTRNQFNFSFSIRVVCICWIVKKFLKFWLKLNFVKPVKCGTLFTCKILILEKIETFFRFSFLFFET